MVAAPVLNSTNSQHMTTSNRYHVGKMQPHTTHRARPRDHHCGHNDTTAESKERNSKLCRMLAHIGYCPFESTCPFAHSNETLWTAPSNTRNAKLSDKKDSLLLSGTFKQRQCSSLDTCPYHSVGAPYLCKFAHHVLEFDPLFRRFHYEQVLLPKAVFRKQLEGDQQPPRQPQTQYPSHFTKELIKQYHADLQDRKFGDDRSYSFDSSSTTKSIATAGKRVSFVAGECSEDDALASNRGSESPSTMSTSPSFDDLTSLTETESDATDAEPPLYSHNPYSFWWVPAAERH